MGFAFNLKLASEETHKERHYVYLGNLHILNFRNMFVIQIAHNKVVKYVKTLL